VVLAGRRRQPLEQTAAEIAACGRRALAVPADGTIADQSQQLVRTTLAEFGHLDVLVNNAGGSHLKPLMDWGPEEWQETLTLNLVSAWIMSRCAAVPMLEQGKRSIVNISSGALLLTMSNAAPYGAAEAGLNNLTGAMAAGLIPRGTRVNGLAVGAVNTGQLTEDARQYLGEASPPFPGNAPGRIGQPDEIGYAVLFFASDASSFCSGQTLWVSGGRRGQPEP
jgi:NAD(P)-dependent dehydrogenase (short-subunit alcohol dehydrogenase family)